MSHCILKQKNGKYCIYSSIIDNLILIEVTKEELLQFYIKRDIEERKRKIEQYCKEADEMNDNEKNKWIFMSQHNKESDNEGKELYHNIKELLGIENLEDIK